MLDNVKIGNKLDKRVFEKESVKIRERLIQVQRDLMSAHFPVLIIVSGNEGAGKGETVNLLLEWMDARGIEVHSFWKPTDEETQRPPYWRFWRAMPAAGRIGIFFGSWYTAPIVDRVFKSIDKRTFQKELERIVHFERLLVQDGALILKFWLHLSKKTQKKYLKKLEEDPETRWRVTKQDWKFFKKYDKFREVSDKALQHTHLPEAPWHVIDAKEHRYRHLTVAKTILHEIEAALVRTKNAAVTKMVADRPTASAHNAIRRLDLTKSLDKETYENLLPLYQGRLGALSRKLSAGGRSLILVFEGNDAAGKGGTIRRLTGGLDAKNYRVIPVAAPTDEERAHPYLWRFWRQLPMTGRVTIYDRSWYGRVLVERIEGFCTKQAWQRAYDEIVEFEKQLTGAGSIIVKFWLAISKEEQLRRFQERERASWKRHKITEEDWRNRKKWDSYETAADEMFAKTHVSDAPWVLVESNNKYYGRVKVLKTVVERLEKNLS